MAVALLSTPAAMTAEQYRRVTEQLHVAGAGTPPGRRSHVCFGHGDRLMMFDVWDSIEELETFTATLMRILDIEHIEMDRPEPLEIHHLAEGGDAGTLHDTIAELRDKAFFIRPIEKLQPMLHPVGT